MELQVESDVELYLSVDYISGFFEVALNKQPLCSFSNGSQQNKTIPLILSPGLNTIDMTAKNIGNVKFNVTCEIDKKRNGETQIFSGPYTFNDPNRKVMGETIYVKLINK
ncbi:MAG: hypothetical protein HY919_07945 [Elusimicrobia bacterium]|nr:hypothetical protein [Elusimicrobiota bacterium]